MTNDILKEQDNTAGGIMKLMKRFRWILILAVATGGAILFTLLWFAFAKKGKLASETAVFAVRRGDLTISVTESGDVKALNSVDIISKVEGRTTIINMVPEGTYIRPEDVNNKILAELDSSEIKERLTQQEIDFSKSQASWTDAIESLDIQKKQNDSDIQAGHMKVRFALIDLHKYLGEAVAAKLLSPDAGGSGKNIPGLVNDPCLGGEALQKLRQLKDNITLAEMNFARAVDKLEGTRKLYDSNYVAAVELQADELEKESIEMQKDRAQTALKLFELYEFPKEVERLLGDYDEARRELERTEAGARSKLAQAQAKLDSAQATYSLQKDRTEKLRRQLEDCTIKAPAPGEVVYASSLMDQWSRQRKLIEVGGEVSERQKIISIPDSSEMKVEVKIHETWIDRVQPDQRAKITIAAFPDKVFTGRVLRKAPLADQQNWLNPDVKVYTTDISIDGTHDFLKTGMTAKVEIIIDELKNVISVPIQAVINQAGTKVCYAITDKGQRPREVQTGAFNNDFVEIKSGLSEGEKVLLNPPRLAESAAPPKLSGGRAVPPTGGSGRRTGMRR